MIRVGLFVVIAALSCALYSISNAQIVAESAADFSDWTPRQREIYQRALNPEGYLTKEDHREFWAPFIAKYGEPKMADVAVIKNMMETFGGVALEFQRETWRSALLSARSGKITQSSGYLAAQQRVRNLKILGVAAQQSADNGDRVLSAAASKTTLQSGGRSFYVTEDLALKILAGLEGAIARVGRLADPQWTGESAAKEVRYADLGIAVLTVEPFTRSDEKVGTGEALTTSITMLSRSLTADSVVMLAVAPMPAGYFSGKSDDRLAGAVSGALNAAGATSTGVTIYQDFRSHRSAIGQGKTANGKKEAFLSLREIMRIDRHDLVQIMAIASDPGTAASLREQLELNLMLLSEKH